MAKQVVHLIASLGKGGAETMLYQVLRCRTREDLSYKVVSLGESHYYEEPIRALGIPVVEVPLRKNPLKALGMILRELRGADTLCCWMYHANLIGYYMGRLAGVKRIVWGIHHSDLSPQINKSATLRLNQWCARISRHVDVVSYTGNAARAVHEQVGYCRTNGVVLSNGCDCAKYCPDASKREAVHQELSIPMETRIVFSATKDIPIKDIPTVVRAFAALHKKFPDTAAVLCGRGVEETNPRIAALCGQSGLTIGQDIFLLSLRNDVNALMAGADLFVLHSAGEAFPVTLVEAMACGCVCVTTDVGDARRILAMDEWVVSPGDDGALCARLEAALSLSQAESAAIRTANRQRVLEHFSIEKIVKEYEELF